MDNRPDLYDKLIMAHSRDPVNFLREATGVHSCKAVNQVCGDSFEIRFDTNAQTIGNVSFYGYGCAVSKAAASMLVDLVNGMTMPEAIAICHDQVQFLQGNRTSPPRDQLEAFGAVRDHPGRFQCAALCWQEFHDVCLELQNANADSP